MTSVESGQLTFNETSWPKWPLVCFFNEPAHTILLLVSHRRTAGAQTGLWFRTVSPEPSLLAYIKYECRRTLDFLILWRYTQIAFYGANLLSWNDEGITEGGNSLPPTSGKIFHAFCRLLNFFKSLKSFFFSKKSFRNTWVSNRLDPDQARRFVGPDLGPICLQRLSADGTRRQRVLSKPSIVIEISIR